ncbi:DNA polymerase III subunit delta' [Elioraea sp.]|uniref:DNA polymerase III subunit delta' n=1 Tax=Elioraea sp. TaxID=2185103 RepID=UPI0021DDF3E9|nr:DNA polymerase III subunit delta' [Elioraea sp.]GIX11180.1 MAG: DNA polymerase III subunit delta' [Elioraea sp.]
MAKAPPSTEPPEPGPRQAERLVGHDAALAAFHAAWRGGRLHHAWLIGGPPGIGKATLAFRIARWVLAGGPETDASLALPPSHPAFRKVAIGSHPDLAVLERSENTKTGRMRTEIVVDDVRTLASFLRLTPAESDWRVAIVDPADDLNREAANALLKILEEPPPRALVLLVAHAPGRLLPTIRSRCRRLMLRPLAEAEVAALLGTLAPDLPPAERRAAAAIARGSVGRALTLAGEGASALKRALEEVIDRLPDVDPVAAHALADSLGRPGGEEEFALFMELLRDAVAARARAAATGGADQIAALRPLEEWGAVWENLGRLARMAAGLTLDRKQAVLSALSALRPGAVLDIP